MNDTTSCVKELSDLLYPHLTKTEDLASHIEHIETVGLFVLRAALIENLRRFDDHLKNQVPKNWKIIDSRKRTIITLLGQITYKRRLYTDECANRHYLLDEVLNIPPRLRIEPAAFIWIVMRAADVSFAKTARDFNAKTGCSITRHTVMKCVHREGELLDAAECTRPATLPYSSPVLFCEFDGFWVHLQSTNKAIPALPRRTYKEQFYKKSAEMKVWVGYAGIKDHKRQGVFHWASDAEPEDFFTECMGLASEVYDMDDLEYMVTGADAAGWCKSNDLDEHLLDKAKVLPVLDRFHINQKVIRAFSSEKDRSTYLDYLYARDFDSFFAALQTRMGEEPDSERAARRLELYSYIASNLDWLQSPSLSRSLRENMISEIPSVFADRGFCSYLVELLQKRCYKRFISALEKIVSRCVDTLRYDYECFLTDARQMIATINRYRTVKLGTMEGTNAKVYAARLKVWGCAWSRKGAIAMMRIRATIASGAKLIAPSCNLWLGSKERASIEKWRERSVLIPETAGQGYIPPQGSVINCNSLSPSVYGTVHR